MPKDEAKAEPMTEKRLAEIRSLLFQLGQGIMARELAGDCDPRGKAMGKTMAELLAEVDRLRALADDDTSLLDWASTNFTNHSLTISEAIEEGYSLRDALRGARDGTLNDDLYGDDEDE